MQGLLGKELELELFLNKYNVSIFCITEHWLKEYQVVFNFDKHQVASSFCRKTAIHGGSLIIANKDLKFKVRRDIVSLSIERTIEIACIELTQCIIVSIYRPPSACYEQFEAVLEELLTKLTAKRNKDIIVCGDFNINLLEDTVLTKRFLSLFKCCDLTNLFLKPTRVTNSSATCIDNIFTNGTPSFSAIINKLHSDHCGQLVSFNYNMEKQVSKRKVVVPVNMKCMERFRNTVANQIEIPLVGSVNDKYGVLCDHINSVFKTVFIPKKISPKYCMSFNDWATPGIYKSRQKLYDLLHEKSYNTNIAFCNYIKNYSKIFKLVCAAAKSIFIRNKIKSSKNKIKMTWNIINAETGRVKERNGVSELIIDNQSIKAVNEVATALEKHFADIPLSTTKALISSPEVAESLLKQNVNACKGDFIFRPIDANEIVKTFKTLEIKNTADLWGISVKIIGTIIDIIAPHLAIIFNECIMSGEFPDLMKHSKVIPLFKSGCHTDPTNYRPISILPACSKLFEKVILGQLLSHFSRNKLLHNKQFGFTRGRSTTDAGVELFTSIVNAWEESRDALGVFCDLSKAFDCVHHDTLTRKLSHYGIKNTALKLLSSYLSDRTQRVEVDGTKSSGSRIQMGVPQGSILGPFLFLIYINDLPYLIEKRHEIVLFADDTSLIFKLRRQETNYDDVNNALSELVHWFSVNNLLLNSKKTNCIKFSAPNVKQVDMQPELNGDKLNLINSTVFLGITIDSKLQWGPHICKLADRLSSAAYAVKRIRLLTDIDTARLVYFSYFHSIMSYGILLWGNAADISVIFILQKRAIRYIYKMGCKESLREKFKEINILTFASQYIYENIMYIRKNRHLFVSRSDRNASNDVKLRNDHKLIFPKCRLKKKSSSFIGMSILIYNKIPAALQSLPLLKFKKIIKRALCNKAYYTINEYLNDEKAWD